MNDPIRVLLVDDHPLVRVGLRSLLDSVDGYDVVGEAVDGQSAIDIAAEQLPDVVVMDLQLPRLDGVEATRRITARHPSIAILVLTMFEDDDSVVTALRAGARGYLLKGAEQAEILRSIDAVAAGQVILGQALAARLQDQLAARFEEHDPIFPALTDREREVLGRVASGHSNATIARQLGLSSKTVANHVSNILTKLQVADRVEAVIQARRAGLGDP